MSKKEVIEIEWFSLEEKIPEVGEYLLIEDNHYRLHLASYESFEDNSGTTSYFDIEESTTGVLGVDEVKYWAYYKCPQGIKE